MKKIESFTLDHTKVSAPYIRTAGIKNLTGGGIITKYDVRFTQPNITHLETDTVHTIEHALATTFRELTPYVVDISPMGCRTGYYVTVDADGIPSIEQFKTLLVEAIKLALTLNETPGATIIECGYAADHNLETAKQALTNFLTQESTLLSVYGDETE